MGKSLGVTATEASVFGFALEEAGVSSDAVAMAGKRLTMALASGGEKFRSLGIATKDANGEFKDTKTLMLEVNERLRGYKEGTDRNIEAQKIYGRSYQDLSKFINNFSYDEDEARKKAQALNLVVSQESVDATKQYVQAKRGLDAVMKGVERTIGEALLPRLTAMAEFFNSHGPAAVRVMRGVMSLYLTVQDAVADAVGALWAACKAAFGAIGDALKEVFGVSSAPMTGMQFFSNVMVVVRMRVSVIVCLIVITVA